MTPYSDDFKAQIIAAVLTGSSIMFVAKQFGVSRSTVKAWVAKVKTSPGSDTKKEKKYDLGERIACYLDQGLVTLEAQAEAFGDPAWLAKQSAGDLAILHGVMADKLLRILSSLEPAES